MPSDKANPRKKIEIFFRNAGIPVPGENDNLFEVGALDSFGLVEFLTYLEREVGVSVPAERITEEDFATVVSVEKLIQDLKSDR
jgi:acyl carrier protein